MTNEPPTSDADDELVEIEVAGRKLKVSASDAEALNAPGGWANLSIGDLERLGIRPGMSAEGDPPSARHERKQ